MILCDVSCSIEKEYEEKLQALQAKHAEELRGTEEQASPEPPVVPAITETIGIEETLVDPEDEARQRKLEKARRKREKQREKEIQRQKEIEEENAKAGPSPRDVENASILERLIPLKLDIHEVAADGHCLYRAVGAHTGKDYTTIRALCANTLKEHETDFAPFVEYSESAPDFEAYVEQVRSSAEWGGHLELRALSMALSKQVHVYSAQSTTALVIGEEVDDADPIRLSYHHHYYALGEHYNQVVPKEI
jgi:OTU domain-containing protein 6